MSESVEARLSWAQSKLAVTSAKLTLVNLLGFLATVVFTILITHRFGISAQTDALFIGRILPLVIATQLIMALSVSAPCWRYPRHAP